LTTDESERDPRHAPRRSRANERVDFAALQFGVLTGGARVFCAGRDPSDRFRATRSQ